MVELASTSKTLRATNQEVTKSFLAWFDENEFPPDCIITFEGLPGAGKSTLVSHLSTSRFQTLEIDKFLNASNHQVDPALSWIDNVLRSDFSIGFERLITENTLPIALDGPAVFPLLENYRDRTQGRELVRIYIKEMYKTGSHVDWLAGKILFECDFHEQKFFKSIYDHHRVDMPWKDANLIIERIPNS